MAAAGRDPTGFAFAAQVPTGTTSESRRAALEAGRSFAGAGATHIILGMPARLGPDGLTRCARGGRSAPRGHRVTAIRNRAGSASLPTDRPRRGSRRLAGGHRCRRSRRLRYRAQRRARARGLAAPYIAGGRDPDPAGRREERFYGRCC